MPKVKMEKTAVDVIRKKGKESLFFLARFILGFHDLDEHIHKPICESLQSGGTRYLIVLPRDWFKSTIGAVAYPIWEAINNPEIRILIVQNSMNNARKKLISIKQIFEKNDLLRSLYPELLPKTRSVWSGECLTLNRKGAHPEGTFEAAGTGTAVISRHYDIIIEDDTVAPQIDDMTGIVQQPTQLEIEKAIGFHRLSHPLLLHPSKSKIVVIGTRWAERDLIGWILANTKGWIHITRSCRENGKIIWSRYSEEVLEEMEMALGPFMFSTLFMNEPLSGIDSMFRRDWIKYYQTVPKKNMVYCTSVDPACETENLKSDPDYTVVLTTGMDRNNGDKYIIYYDRARMNPGEQIDAIFNHYRAYKPLEVNVEAISYQRTLCYWLRKRQEKTNLMFFVNPIKGLKGSKNERIKALQPYFASGTLFLKADMTDLERELLSFPNGAHDDIIDALTMHIEFWYKISLQEEMDKQKEKKDDAFSGLSIIQEITGRHKKLNRYPYDIGIKRDAVQYEQLRVYS